MVNIFVQVNGEWIRALAIPLDDIRRLSIRPLKWLRFATFAALGARGDLLDAPGGNVVNPETEHDDLGQNYYFQDSDPQHIVDNKGLDGRTNSLIASTPSQGPSRRRHARFYSRIARRDGYLCVITGAAADECRATHIIPHDKGDAYIQSVVDERRNIYQDDMAKLDYPASDIDINATQNGIFLAGNLHHRFDLGWSTLLRTPNFGLDTDDIPRENLPDGHLALRTTLQHFVPYNPEHRCPVPQVDVRSNLNWSAEDGPSTVFLDFAYGVAVVKSWATDEFQQVLDDQHNTHYNHPPNTATPCVDDDGNGHGQSEDEEDPEYLPSDQSGGQGRSRMSRSQAMDAVMQISMMMKGYPAGTTFAVLQQKQEEEARARSQQIAQEKVQGWLQEGE